MENRKSVWIRFLRNRTVQKFDIRSDGFLTVTECNLPFKEMLIEVTLLALNMHIKNILKHD